MQFKQINPSPKPNASTATTDFEETLSRFFRTNACEYNPSIAVFSKATNGGGIIVEDDGFSLEQILLISLLIHFIYYYYYP